MLIIISYIWPISSQNTEAIHLGVHLYSSDLSCSGDKHPLMKATIQSTKHRSTVSTGRKHGEPGLKAINRGSAFTMLSWKWGKDNTSQIKVTWRWTTRTEMAEAKVQTLREVKSVNGNKFLCNWMLKNQRKVVSGNLGGAILQVCVCRFWKLILSTPIYALL